MFVFPARAQLASVFVLPDCAGFYFARATLRNPSGIYRLFFQEMSMLGDSYSGLKMALARFENSKEALDTVNATPEGA